MEGEEEGQSGWDTQLVIPVSDLSAIACPTWLIGDFSPELQQQLSLQATFGTAQIDRVLTEIAVDLSDTIGSPVVGEAI